MDIRGFGDAIVRKFYSLGFIKDIPGIYELDFEKIGKLEGFGQKSIDNLQQAIEHSKKQPLHRLIFGLGIRFVGETTAKTLAHAVNHLLDFKKMTLEDFQNLEDVGPKVAGSVHHFFSNKENIAMTEQRSTGKIIGAYHRLIIQQLKKHTDEKNVADFASFALRHDLP